MRFRNYIQFKTPREAFTSLKYGDQIRIKNAFGIFIRGIVYGVNLHMSGPTYNENCKVDVKINGRGETVKWHKIYTIA